MNWESEFKSTFDRAVAAWSAGRRNPINLLEKRDQEFLASIGCTPQELFDFVDDLQVYGEPDYETTLAITRIRREYFLNVMGGKPSSTLAKMSDLPSKSAQIDGIPWLLRLISKARLKLKGEMPADLMYGCGGDRPFVRQMKTDLPAFLKLVWDSGADDRRIVDTVKRQAGLQFTKK